MEIDLTLFLWNVDQCTDGVKILSVCNSSINNNCAERSAGSVTSRTCRKLWPNDRHTDMKGHMKILSECFTYTYISNFPQRRTWWFMGRLPFQICLDFLNVPICPLTNYQRLPLKASAPMGAWKFNFLTFKKNYDLPTERPTDGHGGS